MQADGAIVIVEIDESCPIEKQIIISTVADGRWGNTGSGNEPVNDFVSSFDSKGLQPEADGQ